MDIEPVDTGDLDEAVVTAPPGSSRGGPRKGRCTPEVRAFMSRAVRALQDKAVNESIEIPLDRFRVYGLENIYQTTATLDSCPEAEYVKVEPVGEDIIRIVKLGEPEVRPVKHYSPYRQDE
jgi:hypothetical protein